MNTLMRPGSNISAVYLELPARVLALCILAILPGPVFGAYGCNSGGGVAVPDAPAKPEEAAKVAPAPAVEKPVDPVAKEGGKKKHKGKPNRLAKEKSPYLQQHAYNPVDWYPWGEEAFAKARMTGKPIFLSIGYSTCHWCHVMERESFENEEIAAYLNEHFVAVKVDREERPDVDRVYMDAVQAMRQRGGWPLSAWLTPAGKPFFGGTYFPPEQFKKLLERIVEAWKGQRALLDQQAGKLTEHLVQQADKFQAQAAISPTLTTGVFGYLDQAHDDQYGGFSGPPRYAPKFPRTSNLDFLLNYSIRIPSKRSETMVYTTLDRMIAGGIRDHLAGGFHRYSTDRLWLLPHFEKMLYDNALISRTLIGAYKRSGNERYLRVAREALDYVITRLRDKDGGFYSAEDADTEGVEGLTYVWTRKEILDVLGEKPGELFCEFYGVQAGGNFKEERPDPGSPEHANILHLPFDDWGAALAGKRGLSLDALYSQVAVSRGKLLKVRDKRAQPFLDSKVLVEWNGLAISALAQAYQVSAETRYLEAAQAAAGFISSRMVRDGALYRRYKDGEVGIRAFLEDYAFLVDGLLDLYESDFDRRWLELALELGRQMVGAFWDEKKGAFFSTASHHEKLILRRKEFYDGALPSGNSLALLDMLRLQEFTADKVFEEPVKVFKGLAAGLVEKFPHMHPQLSCALEFILFDPLEIVVCGPLDDPRTRAMLKEIRGRFLPAKVVVHSASAEAAASLSSLVPLVEAKMPIGGKPTAFVCRRRVCKLPARDLATLRRQLDEMVAEKKASGESK